MMQFTTPSIRYWLTTLGYQVSDQPQARVAAIFCREARQWGLTPQELSTLVQDPDHTSALDPKPGWTPLVRALAA